MSAIEEICGECQNTNGEHLPDCSRNKDHLMERIAVNLKARADTARMRMYEAREKRDEANKWANEADELWQAARQKYKTHRESMK